MKTRKTKAKRIHAVHVLCFRVLGTLWLAVFGLMSEEALGTDDTLAERILAAYDAVETVSCTIQRRWQGPDGRIRMNSRVHWHRPRRLHVDNYSPLRRRYVCDGKNFFYHIHGEARGFSRPVEDLDADWQLRLDVVPGSPMEYLIPLRGLPETIQDDDGNKDGARRGYVVGEGLVALHADSKGRLVRYEKFARADDEHPVLVVVYSQFKEALPDVWLPMRHQTTARAGGKTRVETMQVVQINVNEPLAPRLFVAEPFFEGVDFVDSFEKIYK